MRNIFAAAVLCLCASQLFANPIQTENEMPGTPGWWLRNPARNHEIEGFADQTSIRRGESIAVKVRTRSSKYMWEVYRLGWYQGLGARLYAGQIPVSRTRQPPCDTNRDTWLVDCPWSTGFIVQTQSDWTSGVYVMRLTETDTFKDSFVIFVVRDDEREADLVYTHSVTTDLAYNPWGGHHLYNGAVKASLNRPMAPPPYAKEQHPVGTAYFFAYYDFNLLMWLEKEGFDVKYISNLDVHEDYSRMESSRVFLSVGHDEYWSREMRDNLSRYRDTGRSIMFFSSNTLYWQVRFEPDARGNPNRIMTCYKNATKDPEPDPKRKTVRWRDKPVSDPEDELMGVLTDGDFPINHDLKIRDASHWVFDGTGLKDGDVLKGMLGFETDRMHWSAPPSTERLGTTMYIGPHGGPSHTDMILYTTDQGGIVFAPGSMQWIWGLNDIKIWSGESRGFENDAVKTITHNLLAKALLGPAAISRYSKDPELLHLRFDDAPGSTHFKDKSSYNRSVLCFEPTCPKLVRDNTVGQTLEFSGKDQYLDLGVEPSVRGTNAFFVSFSIKMEPGVEEHTILQQRDDYNTGTFRGYDGSYKVGVDRNGKIVFWTYTRENNHALDLRSEAAIKDGKWHNVTVLRHLNGDGSIVIDGVESARQVAKSVDVLKPHTIFLGHDAVARQEGLIARLGYVRIMTW